MCKFTNIPSEINEFFKEKRRDTALSALTRLVEGFHVGGRLLGSAKRENCKFTNLQLFQLLLLMPLFAVSGFSHYAMSGLGRMFGGKKDLFYSFMSRDDIDWRGIIYRNVVALIARITVRQDFKRSHLPAVLIADDTDLPKTGMRIEMIGKVFSHVRQKCILGYKALVMCWSDGRTQFATDMSLNGEKGKIDGKEQGLTARQRGARFSRRREEGCHTSRRKGEYFKGKGEKLVEMVKRAVRFKIPFEYLLVDSWFTCTGLVDFVCRCHKKFHLIGMAKMGTTKYRTRRWGDVNARTLVDRLVAAKQRKYSRRLRCHYVTADAELGGRAVRLFFCKRGRREGWRALLTTDTSLDFLRAYEIYAMRWSIEVFFSDSKRLLGLADCSARDLSSQIAHVSMVMLRYNLLAMTRRLFDYETIGSLFSDVYMGVHEVTVIEKIWALVTHVVAIVAELSGADEETLMRQIISDDRKLAALKSYAESA